LQCSKECIEAEIEPTLSIRWEKTWAESLALKKTLKPKKVEIKKCIDKCPTPGSITGCNYDRFCIQPLLLREEIEFCLFQVCVRLKTRMGEHMTKKNLNQKISQKNIEFLAKLYQIDLLKLKQKYGLMSSQEEKEAAEASLSKRSSAISKLKAKAKTTLTINAKKINLVTQMLVNKIKMRKVRQNQNPYLKYFYYKNVMIELLLKSEAMKTNCVDLLKKKKKAYLSSKAETDLENMKLNLDKWRKSTEECKKEKQKYINVILNMRAIFKVAFQDWEDIMNGEVRYLTALERLGGQLDAHARDESGLGRRLLGNLK
jgi:hypothetical protein